MAAINKRGNSWILSWQQHGRQFRKSLGPITLQNAKLQLHAKEIELATGQRPLAGENLFVNFIEEYLDWHATEYPNSHLRIAQICQQHLLPYFEFYPLDKIRLRDAELYKTQRLKSGIKLSTLNKELRTLKALLNKAHYWEYISNNPLHALQFSKELDSKPERFYSKEELELIYQWAPYNWFWWKLLAHTGLRRTEALQLKWEHVQEDELVVVSSRTERTKSGKWRKVPLNQNAKHALQRFKRDRNSEYVFPRHHARSMTRSFDRVLARTPIADPKGSLHCLRHTFCSNLVIAGVPLRTVQKLAGHASYSTTEKYAHLSKDHLTKAVNLLDDDDF